MSIMIIATLKLNSPELLKDWKMISDEISADLKANATGFISRDAVIAEDGSHRCILKWESQEASEAFMQSLPSRPDFMEKMANFSRVVNLESMKKEIFKLL